jgi:predicted nucleic acid-binding Zn ribbon protein
MESTKKPKEHLNCAKCGAPIPASRRSDAKYCTQSCRAAAEKKRYKATHPDYVERQKKIVNRIRHLKEHGHTDFLDKPELNPKDKFALARSLGYRSMLEYTVAQQLLKAGVPFIYEGLKITYFKSKDDVFDEEDQINGNEKRWW